MNFIIPMAGKGSRFTNAGYTIPKYLIEVNNKILLEYSLYSLPLELCTNLIFICLKEHNEKYNLQNIIQNILKHNNFKIIELIDVTNGQAETVLQAENYFNKNDLLIYNIDTYFKSNNLAKKLMSDEKHDGILGAFIDEQTKWSFAEVDKKGFVTKTTEKIPISQNALTGLYHFTNPSDFLEIAKHNLNNKITDLNEYFIAPMYNNLIQQGRKFVLDFVDEFIPLGTPEDINVFKDNKDK